MLSLIKSVKKDTQSRNLKCCLTVLLTTFAKKNKWTIKRTNGLLFSINELWIFLWRKAWMGLDSFGAYSSNWITKISTSTRNWNSMSPRQFYKPTKTHEIEIKIMFTKYEIEPKLLTYQFYFLLHQRCVSSIIHKNVLNATK